jgi:hypothetical protein
MTKFLKVHFTRAKVFQHHNGIAEQRFQVAPGVNMQVPLWVKNTLGWEMGVKDGSIVDLTPPEPIAAPVTAAAEKAEPDVKEPEVEDTDEEEAGEEASEEAGEEASEEAGEEPGEEETVVAAKPAKKPRNTHGLQK